MILILNSIDLCTNIDVEVIAVATECDDAVNY